MALTNNLKTIQSINIWIIHCDDADENKAFEQEGLDIKFEHIIPDMPQQNGRVEHEFAILYNRVHDMLNGVNLFSDKQSMGWGG